MLCGMPRMRIAAVLAAAVSIVAPGLRPAPVEADPGIVTADQVTGTWRSGRNEFRLLALGRGRLRVEFAGTREYRTGAGPTANTGETSGTASIEGTTAILKPSDLNGDCTITLKFAPDAARSKGGAASLRMVVTQDGECGFGLGVTADGTYRRASARKPTFSE